MLDTSNEKPHSSFIHLDMITHRAPSKLNCGFSALMGCSLRPGNSFGKFIVQLDLFDDMCMQVVEKYAVCHCMYHKHSVDPCPYYGRHSVIEKIVYVGSSCPNHSG
ncbi:hypothetical protein B0J11DRAFT_341814 [Dendryphion nanum]|uniref:Uncharacterized protein n=1 Tax=Dendryphion nanum TaxID=256645 RepID=A0A9P9DQ08_9PLEO|nr:hypothetical protein B0J11DRAFT_341814 [Dendryphion nanum]